MPVYYTVTLSYMHVLQGQYFTMHAISIFLYYNYTILRTFSYNYIILSTHTGAEFILVNMYIPFFAVIGDLNVRAVLRWARTAPEAIPSFQHGLIAVNHKNAIIGISIDPVSYSCCNISCHTSIRDLP